eukprot:scaffold3394_cov23-Cyclotella_meneghiniana.AAC.6
MRMRNNRQTPPIMWIYQDVRRDEYLTYCLRKFYKWGRRVSSNNLQIHLKELASINTHNNEAMIQFCDDILGITENLNWVLHGFELSIEFDLWTMILIHISQDFDHELAREWIDANILENYVVVDRFGYLNGQVQFDDA